MSPHRVVLDVEVYADQHAERLEEMEAEHVQVLEDAAEFEAFNCWADQAVQSLPDWPAQVLA
jgi:hypothetical protein